VVAVLIVALMVTADQAKQISIVKSGDVASIENGEVRLSYDLSTGLFGVADKKDRTICLVHAFSRFGIWASNQSGYRHAAEERTVRDDLGAGKSLRIRSLKEGQPGLILDVSMYQDQGFIVLAGGIENTTGRPIQLKEFYPLCRGDLFPSIPLDDAKTLDGPSGGLQTEVRKGPYVYSPNNVLLTFTDGGRRRSLVAGGLTYHEFLKWVQITGDSPSFSTAQTFDGRATLNMKADDPVGKRIDPGATYMGDDRFYVDFTTANPFEALERYGQALRVAQKTNPNPYEFPTLCSWWAAVAGSPGAQDHPEKSKYALATTKGQVAELEYINQLGFSKYSRVALRIVPDNYTPNNMNGWWDNEHYRQTGFFVPPYDTAEKWGKAMHARGGLPGFYIQPDRVSLDFRQAHPELLIPGKHFLDYTIPETQAHVRKVYANLRAGGMATIMFDYCDDLWGGLSSGGFQDKQVTAASCYRKVLSFAKEGLGPDSWVHERPIHSPGSDIAAGIVDSQRTTGDTTAIRPALIARSGLRWYKSRVIMAYDMDGKDMLRGWKAEKFAGTDRDGRRMMLTMCYVAGSRLLLANSFRDMPKEALHDLERVVPSHATRQSARPLDAFACEGWPKVYDFCVTPQWHQLTLLNDVRPGREQEMIVALRGDTATGALGLDADREYYVYDFWNDRFVGKLRGNQPLKQVLRPGEARMLSIHTVEPNPQFLSTNRHIMQGYVDMIDRPSWDAAASQLRGRSKVVGAERYKIMLAANGRKIQSVSAVNARAAIEAYPGNPDLVVLCLDSETNADVAWTVSFNLRGQ
jgi:hypothetical protein